MTATRLMIAVIPVLLVTGCRPSDDRLTRLMQQQAATHQEMTRLNREVAAGMTQLTQENAAFRKEALAVQQRLHQQQTDLLRKQERLDAERRQLLQRDLVPSESRRQRLRHMYQQRRRATDLLFANRVTTLVTNQTLPTSLLMIHSMTSMICLIDTAQEWRRCSVVISLAFR